MAQNNLANAYLDRIRGERAENIEEAIACCQAALEVYNATYFPKNGRRFSTTWEVLTTKEFRKSELIT
jgi:hypothetical protein